MFFFYSDHKLLFFLGGGVAYISIRQIKKEEKEKRENVNDKMSVRRIKALNVVTNHVVILTHG